MVSRERGLWISWISLIVSVLALLAVAVQTFVQWQGRYLPLQSNILALQLEACTSILGSMITFSNTNAELRLALASATGGNSTGMDVYQKSDRNPAMSKVIPEEIIDQKGQRLTELAADTNRVLVSNLHLFSSETQRDLMHANRMIVELVSEPEGNSRVLPSDFNKGIELFRSDCSDLSEDFLVSEGQT